MENPVIEKKKFSNMEKSMLLASARNLIRNFTLKKDKYVKERDMIRDNFETALQETINKKIAEMKKRGAAQLEKRLEKLNEKIEEMDKQQQNWERPIIDATGMRMESIFGYEIKNDSGKNTLNVFFKYPETVVPEDFYNFEPECPTHAGSDFDLDAGNVEQGEPWTDEAVAAQTSATEEEPEYDSAGFSTEDGLQEGEPAELAEVVNQIPEPTDEERELLEQQWEEEKAEAEDSDAEETAEESEDLDDDPFFLD